MGHYAAQLIKNGKTVCVDFAPVINMAEPHHVALKAHEPCGSVRLKMLAEQGFLPVVLTTERGGESVQGRFLLEVPELGASEFRGHVSGDAFRPKG